MSVESWRWYNPASHVARHALRDVDKQVGAASDGSASGFYNLLLAFLHDLVWWMPAKAKYAGLDPV